MEEVVPDQFFTVDIRIGKITAVEDFPEAHKPAWKLIIDFGNQIGIKQSSARIKQYSKTDLLGRLVVGVVNFPPRQIGPIKSEVLVLGVSDSEGEVVLLAPDREVLPGQRVH